MRIFLFFTKQCWFSFVSNFESGTHLKIRKKGALSPFPKTHNIYVILCLVFQKVLTEINFSPVFAKVILVIGSVNKGVSSKFATISGFW